MSLADSVGLVRSMIRTAARAAKLDPALAAKPDPALVDDMRLAISEACNNAVLHAYPSTPGPLIFSLAVEGDTIEAIVRDHGCGIRPGSGRNRGLGMGVTLINALADRADRAEFESSDLGTEVRTHFKRSVRVPGALAVLAVSALTDPRSSGALRAQSN
jgi:anti-sigma regulatory factor (Ser/Thr protein kinase)